MPRYTASQLNRVPLLPFHMLMGYLHARNKHRLNPLRVLVTCVCLLVPLVAPTNLNGHTTALAAQSNSSCNTRYLVLLDGIGSQYKTVLSSFGSILGAIQPAFPALYPLVYNYTYSKGTYTSDNTFSALPSNGENALASQINAAITACQGATFDLLGYSLGGTVAFDYLRDYYRQPSPAPDGTTIAQHVDHIITLDSPVNGFGSDRAIFDQYRDWFANVFPGTLAGSTIDTLLSVNGQGNQSIADSLRRAGIWQSYISNTDDLFITPADAQIPTYSYPYSLGNDLLPCGAALAGSDVLNGIDPSAADALLQGVVSNKTSCIGHHQVLDSAQVNSTIEFALKQNLNGSTSGTVTPTPTFPPSKNPPCVDAVSFVTDVNYTDGYVFSPDQSFNKTWRLRNSGNCTWTGYSLTFVSGDHLSGPSSVSVQTTAPGQTVDVTVPLVAPTSGGSFKGYWQLKNSQGVYVQGDNVWVAISIPGGSKGTPVPGCGSITAKYLSVVAPGQHFQPQVTVSIPSGQLLQNRGDMLRNMDGNLYGGWPQVAVVGTVNTCQPYTFTFYTNNPIVAPNAEGNYQSVWGVWQNGSWTGLNVTISFTVKNGGGTRPNPPTLTSPSNWAAIRDGSTPALCAQSSDSNVQYNFQIYNSAQTPDSGWISNNCWTPSPALGPYTFAWHVRVQDNDSGLVSDWSDTWNFTLFSQQLSMDPLSFSPGSPSNSDGNIQVRTCVQGFGNINLGLSYEVNHATDGSATGDWTSFTNGNNCPDPNNTSTWASFPSRDYADGDHLVRAIGVGPQGQTMSVQAVYHLDHRRPQDADPISPIQGMWLNNQDVTFVWRPSVNAQSYKLVVSTNPDLSAPLFNQNVGNVTSNQVDLTQALAPVYWQVTAINDVGQAMGNIATFGINLTPPVAAVTPLQSPETDTSFTVSWSGTGDAAGIDWYNVQYRDGNGADSQWVDWQTNTPAAGALFTGQPGHTYYFRAQALDNAGNLSTYAGGDGDTYTMIDLNARPQTPWWNADYANKRDLVILNNDSHQLPAGYPIHVHLDSSTTPSAADIYNASQTSNKGDDVRIVYQDQTEAPRYLETFSANQIDIWFDLQQPIAPSPANDGTNYQIYYGDPTATPPSTTLFDVLPVPTCDANTVALWTLTDDSGSTASDACGGHDGTIANGSWSKGLFNLPALAFNGTNTSVTVSDSPDFNLPAFTIEAYVNRSLIGTSEMNLIRREIIGSGPDEFRLGIADNKVRAVAYCFDFYGNTPFQTQLPTNEWTQIVFSFNGNTLSDYIDGVLDRSVTYDNPGCQSHSAGSGPVVLGNFANSSSPWFAGGAQFIRISNIARSPASLFGAYKAITNAPSVGLGSLVVPPTGAPSLAVQGVQLYTAADGGYIVSAQVANQGSANTANDFSTSLYLNHQPTGPGDQTGSISNWQTSPIDAGQVITLTTAISSAAILDTGNNVATPNLNSTATDIPAERTAALYLQADATGALATFDKPDLTITQPITICVAAPDIYKPDSTATTANAIATDGTTQVHNFTKPGDQDWVSFTAEAGTAYTISTSNLADNADTVLSLYDQDETTLLESNDDYNNSLASQITWQAPASGTYYVQVTQWDSDISGCGTSFDLSISTSTPQPTITQTSIPSNTDTPTPVLTATPTATPTSTLTTVSIPASQPWTDTGVDVTAGEILTLSAGGTIFIAGSDPGKTPDGAIGCLAPAGFSLPSLTCWSLIGQIGTGTPFAVGSDVTLAAPATGRLYLGVNDDVFSDNSGSWTAVITPNSGNATSTPTQTFTQVPDTFTSTDTPTDTATSTATATATTTDSPTTTRTTTATVTATATSPAPTYSSTITPAMLTKTATGTKTATATKTPVFTKTVTPSKTPVFTKTATATKTVTATWTVSATRTATVTKTPLPTKSATATKIPSKTATGTRTGTPTRTAVVTSTSTRTSTPTNSSTATTTASPTSTATQTPGPSSGWTYTANTLQVGRFNGRATRLSDGRILVEGGSTFASGDLAESEIYDPATNSWAPTGSLGNARADQSATLLLNGKVLVVAGDASGTSAELYDPSTGQWTVTGSLNQVRGRQTATLLANGQVLVAGGYQGCMIPSAEVYDPSSGTWSMTGSMSTPRADAAAVLLPSGKVLVAGGDDDCPSRKFASAELYDPSTGTWSPTGSMNIPRAHFSAVLLPDGRVFAVGGDNDSGTAPTQAEIYDPSSGTWSLAGNMSASRFFPLGDGAAVLPDGTVLVAGGNNQGTSEIYHPTSNSWDPPVLLLQPQCGASMSQLNTGRVLLISGNDCTSSTVKVAEAWSP